MTCIRTGHGGSEGLLHQRGLICSNSGESNGVMLRMRGGDVDHIHARIGHDLLVRPVRTCQTVLSGKGFRSLGGAAGYCHRLGTCDVRKVLDHQRRDATWSDDPPANSR